MYGPQKRERERLEEVKPIKTTQPASTPRKSSSLLTCTSSALSQTSLAAYWHEWRMESLVHRMPLQMPSTIVLRDKLVSLFLDMYLPAGFHLSGPSPISWLNEALSLNNPGQVLSLSIQALSTIRVGRSSGDELLTKQGNMLYVRALRELRRALVDRHLMWRDEILAATRTLGIYEASEMNISKLLYRTKG
jgi:hypothetical protein